MDAIICYPLELTNFNFLCKVLSRRRSIFRVVYFVPCSSENIGQIRYGEIDINTLYRIHETNIDSFIRANLDYEVVSRNAQILKDYPCEKSHIKNKKSHPLTSIFK